MTELFKQNRLVFKTDALQEAKSGGDKVDVQAKGPDAAISPEQQKKVREIALELMVKGMKDKKVIINGKEYSDTSEESGDKAYTTYLDAIRKGIEDALIIAMQENPEINVEELKNQAKIVMNYLISAQKQHETERQNLEKAKAMISSKEHTDSRFTIISIGGGKEYVVANDILEGVKTEFANKIAMFLGMSEDPQRVYYFEGKLTTAGENLMDQILIQMKAKSGIEKTVTQEKLSSREQYNQKRLADRGERIKRADADPILKAVIDKLPNKITFGPIRVGRSSEQNKLNVDAEISRVADDIAKQFNVEGGIGLDAGSLSWISYEVNLLTRQILREKGLYNDLKTGKQVSIDFGTGKKDLYVLAVDYKNKVDQRKATQKPAVADAMAGAVASQPAETAKAQAEGQSAPVEAAESAELVYNKEQFLEAIFKHLEGAVEGYSLIRYEVKGTRSLDAEQRKLSKDEIVAYFAKLGDAALSQVFEQGMKKMKEGDPKTIDQVVTYGLTWFEYTNRDARMAKIPTTAPAGTETAQEGATAQEGKADAVPESTEPTNILEGLKQADKLEQIKALLDQHKKYKRTDWKLINPKLVKIITGKDEAIEEAKGIEMVKDLQQKLIDAGHDVGKDGTDGRAGINTLNALKAYLELTSEQVKRSSTKAKSTEKVKADPSIEMPELTKGALKNVAQSLVEKLGEGYLISSTEYSKSVELGVAIKIGLTKNGKKIADIKIHEKHLPMISIPGIPELTDEKLNVCEVYNYYGDAVEGENLIDKLTKAEATFPIEVTAENLESVLPENLKGKGFILQSADDKEIYMTREGKDGYYAFYRKDGELRFYGKNGAYYTLKKGMDPSEEGSWEAKAEATKKPVFKEQEQGFTQAPEPEPAPEPKSVPEVTETKSELKDRLENSIMEAVDGLGAEYSIGEIKFAESRVDKKLLGSYAQTDLYKNGEKIGMLYVYDNNPKFVILLDNKGKALVEEDGKPMTGSLVERVAALEVAADKKAAAAKAAEAGKAKPQEAQAEVKERLLQTLREDVADKLGSEYTIGEAKYTFDNLGNRALAPLYKGKVMLGTVSVWDNHPGKVFVIGTDYKRAEGETLEEQVAALEVAADKKVKAAQAPVPKAEEAPKAGEAAPQPQPQQQPVVNPEEPTLEEILESYTQEQSEDPDQSLPLQSGDTTEL